MFRTLRIPAAVLLVIVCVGVADFAIHGRIMIAEGPPVYAPYFAARSFVAFLTAAGTILSVIHSGKFTGYFELATPIPAAGVSFVFLCILIFLVSIALLIIAPPLFSRLAREDSAFEWFSAIFLLLGSLAAFAAATRIIRASKRSRGSGFLPLIMATVLFLIAMEEMSWMQRVFAFETPHWLEPYNIQNEFNLHNLATDQIENLYYAGTFLLLVFFPIFCSFSPVLRNSDFLRPFVPGRHVFIIGALTTTFSYEMWNIFWVQFAFYFSLMALGVYSVIAKISNNLCDAAVFAVAAIVLLISQLADLSYGSTMVRYWEDTELKELIIALGLMAYAMEIYFRACEPRRSLQN